MFRSREDEGKHRTVMVTKMHQANLTRETARAMQAEKASAAQVESISDTNAFNTSEVRLFSFFHSNVL